MELSDQDIDKALIRSRVPKVYRKKGLKTFDQLGAMGHYYRDEVNRIGRELRTGGVFNAVGSEAKHTDLFYLMARALVINGHPATCIEFPMLQIDRREEPDFFETVGDYSILCIPGLEVTGPQDPFGSMRQTIEWRFIDWLNDGRGLMILSDGEITDDPYWSDRFKSIIADRTIEKNVRW